MSAVAGPRVDRGGRQQQPRSSNTSASPSGASTPVPTGPKNAGGKATPALPKMAEQNAAQKTQPPGSASSASGNVWNQRRSTTQQGIASNPGVADNKPASTANSYKKSPEANHGPVNGFNSAEVRALLSEKSSSFKPYSGSKSSSTNTGKMANGQSFFALLNRQVTQFQVAL